MTCLTARQSDDGQYVHEDVDDVQVEVEGGNPRLVDEPSPEAVGTPNSALYHCNSWRTWSTRQRPHCDYAECSGSLPAARSPASTAPTPELDKSAAE